MIPVPPIYYIVHFMHSSINGIRIARMHESTCFQVFGSPGVRPVEGSLDGRARAKDRGRLSARQEQLGPR